MLSALDFAETRSEDDARLLTTARGRKKGDRMSADEAKALRRKVGGTASELLLVYYVHHPSIMPSSTLLNPTYLCSPSVA